MLEKFPKNKIRNYFSDGFAEVEAKDERVVKIFLNHDDFMILGDAVGLDLDICTKKEVINSGVLGSLWGAMIYKIEDNRIIFSGEEYEFIPDTFRNRKISKYKFISKC